MIKKLKEKKGFTLVELIVVLVILAILAALLIPALTGYIDKAKKKNIIAETRQIVMAAQTLADEAYGKKDIDGKIEYGKDVTAKDVKELSEVTLSKNDTIEFESTGSKVATVTHTASGYTCKYSATAQKGASDGHYNVVKVGE